VLPSLSLSRIGDGSLPGGYLPSAIIFIITRSLDEDDAKKIDCSLERSARVAMRMSPHRVTTVDAKGIPFATSNIKYIIKNTNAFCGQLNKSVKLEFKCFTI